jgi:fatty-acyl-CoA synthase
MTMFEAGLTTMVARSRSHSLGDLLRRSAHRVPAKLAVVFGSERQTYAQLDETVNRTANALADRGVARGDRVVLFSHNHSDVVVVYFALARLGAISVPVNFMLTSDEVGFVLAHAGATAVVAEDVLVPVVAAAIDGLPDPAVVTLRGVIDTGGPAAPGRWEPVDVWRAHTDAREPEVAVADDDVVQLMYTSGTESRPKGVALSSRSLIAQYVSCVIDGGMEASDVEVHALPLYHCAALHAFFTPGVYLGATNIILPGADPTGILATVEAERATKLFCPPTVWISLLRHPDLDRYDLSSLRKGYYGASIMPVEVLKEMGDRFPGTDLYNFYGQTELSPLATVLGPADQVRKAGSAGRAGINVETMVVDDDDRPVKVGEVGEIVHRSPHATLGYWNDPEKTAEAFRHGWFHSGDLGVLDEEGYLTVVDRKKDMIKTGGENVASREVEEVIYQHPAVSEVAVFATSDPRWIEAVTAAVVVRAGREVSEAELIEFCRQRLAGYKAPKRVVVVDALPRNASGKVLKRELRQALS